MRQGIIFLISGILFGMGVTIGGMTDPGRVRGFLDIFGAWDPTLVFVMGGAMAVMMVAWLIQRRTKSPLVCGTYALPDTKRIDRDLILGAALFGIGWGLAGLCPGPAFASLALQPAKAALFVLAMLAGIALNTAWTRRRG